MAEFHSAQHFVFGQLVSFRFHHHHGVFGAGDDQIKALIRVVAQALHVVHAGVQHIVATREANAGRANRAHERHAGNRKRGGHGHHGNDIGVIHQIVAQHGCHHEDFVLEAFDEQRAAGTVDQTRGQRFFFRGTRFAFEKAARDFPGGVVFLLVMHGQREEILSRFRRACIGHVGHDRGFAIGGDHRSVGLTGDLARFQCQRFIAPLD